MEDLPEKLEGYKSKLYLKDQIVVDVKRWPVWIDQFMEFDENYSGDIGKNVLCLSLHLFLLPGFELKVHF